MRLDRRTRQLLPTTSSSGAGCIARQQAAVVIERRREQERLSRARDRRQHPAQRWEKSQVEHAAGFIESEHAGQIDRALLQVIDQPAGRRDDDVDAAPERITLRCIPCDP